MWVESDTQLISGESLARQFLYGQRYFMDKFKFKCEIGWLPDTFGFSVQLPQIMCKSGLKVFITHKVMWNDTNSFPYHAFIWDGIDGSSIITHILPLTYNGILTANEFTIYGLSILGKIMHQQFTVMVMVVEVLPSQCLSELNCLAKFQSCLD